MDYKLETRKELMPRKILCPICGNRFYPTRIANKKYTKDKYVDVHCDCGAWYQIVNNGCIGIIRLRREYGEND